MLKEKFLATEKMSFEEGQQIKSFEDLKNWLNAKQAGIKASVISIPPELTRPGEAVVPIPEASRIESDKITEHINAPIDMDKVNVVKSKKVSGKKSNLAERIGEAVANNLDKQPA